jgi:hypothetical protein
MHTDMFEDEDLLANSRKPKRAKLAHAKQEASALLANMSGMSARERAVAQRKAKAQAKRGSAGGTGGGGGAGHQAQASVANGAAQGRQEGSGGSGEGASAQQERAVAAAAASEEEWGEIVGGRWPFQTLADQLCIDVLHPVWEVRHGAALALREVLGCQAPAAAVHVPVGPEPAGVCGVMGVRDVLFCSEGRRKARGVLHCNQHR